jgi:hypothetical protein
MKLPDSTGLHRDIQPLDRELVRANDGGRDMTTETPSVDQVAEKAAQRVDRTVQDMLGFSLSLDEVADLRGHLYFIITKAKIEANKDD